VLQDRTFEVLGSSHARTVDVRVVAATNKDLGAMVARGEFREDLLYRINLITIHLPPLRERPDDIPLLASRFLQAAAATYRRETVVLTPAAARWLQAQPWPGNVRQLHQAVERAVLVDTRDRLDVESFTELASAPARDQADSLPDVGAMTIDEIERAMILKSLRHHGGNISRVAESLGLSRPALYRRFEKYEISV
jgi:DNA-binding NtrC family response regulator